jgi:hypothetical protein
VGGGARRPQSQMRDFHSTLDFCNLHDMGYSGSLFTWSNERHDSSFTKERLDRGVANGSFALLFPQLLIEVLPARCSDHAPLLVHLQDQRNCRRDRQRPFKYEVWWQVMSAKYCVFRPLDLH